MIVAYKIKPKLFAKLQQTGFTLIEAMLVLMLLVILVSGIIPFIFYTHEPKLSEAERNDQQNILIIKNALNFYKLDNGFYPGNDQGLEALVSKPDNPPVPQHWIQYLPQLPVDQWGQKYQYINDEGSKKIDLSSCGSPPAKQSWWYRLTHYFSKQACEDK